jgi:hypothetical protein
MKIKKAKTNLVYLKRNKGSTEIKWAFVFRANTLSSSFLLFPISGNFTGPLYPFNSRDAVDCCFSDVEENPFGLHSYRYDLAHYRVEF